MNTDIERLFSRPLHRDHARAAKVGNPPDLQTGASDAVAE